MRYEFKTKSILFTVKLDESYIFLVVKHGKSI